MTRKPAKHAAPSTAASLRKLSKAELADAFGPIAKALGPLEKKAKLFKDEFERRGVTLLVGAAFSVQRSETSFKGIDIVAAKAALGADWCEANEKPVTRVSWKATALNAADAADDEEAA